MKFFFLCFLSFFSLSFALPVYGNVFLNKGLQYYKQKKFLLAIGQFKKAVTNQETATQAHFYLGNCYLNNGNVEKATRHYTQALSVAQNNDFKSQILINLGQALHLGGNYRSAINDYSRAYSLNSDLVQSFWLEGMAYYSLHDKASVIQSWENYLTLRPTGKQSDNIRKALLILKATNFSFPQLADNNRSNSTNSGKTEEKQAVLDIEGVLDQIQPNDKGKVTDDEMEDIVK